jgi:C-terminal processing protease CtpA/Prc
VGSGIRLNVKPPHYDVVLVRDVIAGSPAAHAGLQPGDRIMRIRLGTGKFLGATSLTQVYKALAKSDEHVTLYLSRGGKAVEVSF